MAVQTLPFKTEYVHCGMLFNASDLDSEIQDLHVRLEHKRRLFNEGIKEDREFAELKMIFSEIRQLSQRQQLCFEERKTCVEST